MTDESKISRRRFLESAGAAAIAVSSASRVRANQPPAKKPNILFLMDDQHRGDALGIAGDNVVQTPHLDALARDGAYFSKAHVSVPSCVAARASLLTGQSPWGHGMLGYADQSKRWPLEKPRFLHDHGYYSMSIGKNHFTPMRNARGYDRVQLYDGLEESDKVDDYGQWLAKVAPGTDEHATGLGWNDRGGKPWPHADELHPTSWTGQRAVDFLSSYTDEKPFFLKVSFHRPHTPWDPPPSWFDYYARQDLPKAQVGEWAEKWYGSFKGVRAPAAARAALSAEEIRNSRQGYYGSISHVDQQIGHIIKAMQQRSDFENTLIVFVSDHGEMVGDHHLWRKTWAYEGSSRIPMIVRWGSDFLSAKRGQVLSQLTELRDVLPTFLDAAGCATPASVEGQSLLNLVRGQTANWRTQLDMEHSICYFAQNQWTALMDDRHKYIYFAPDGQQQLFDLENDPNELHDLAGDPAQAELLKSWRQRMVDHLKARGPKWVKDGDLMLRPKPMPYGQNFPDKPT